MDDSELRRRFARLRETDRESVPSFAQTYARARQRPRARLRGRTLVFAAAAVAIAAVWIAQGRSMSPESTASIATWRAPTDVFLRIPGSELLGAVPTLGASVLDTMIPTAPKEGGA